MSVRRGYRWMLRATQEECAHASTGLPPTHSMLLPLGAVSVVVPGTGLSRRIVA